MTKKRYCSIGLMSGTSLDGIDAAVISSDGEQVFRHYRPITVPYHEEFKDKLRALMLLEDAKSNSDVEEALTLFHVEAVEKLLETNQLKRHEIDVIGFHGQTILHRPEMGLTVQIGDGRLLAEKTGINVVHSLRQNDVASGGQGAPLVPLYHAALLCNQPKPVAVVNIGGVANVSWINAEMDTILAFDTGPGNALMDDWILERTGRSHDVNGRLAAKGQVDGSVLQQLLSHPFFEQMPPKSLDRHDFSKDAVAHLSTEDGVATLAAFTSQSIANAAVHFPKDVSTWYIAGGGRHNTTLLKMLADVVSQHVTPIDVLGVNGDAIEAEAFAYLAVRSLLGWPLTLPSTTGVKEPTTGGVLALAKSGVPA